MKYLLTVALACLGLAVAGCNTFERRAQQRSATFESLTPEEREKLRKGVIEIGNNPDMVYIALGDPDERREVATPNGRESIWTYNSYFQEYEGQVYAGTYRRVVYDPHSRRYYIYHQPVYSDVYSEHEEERIRVKFRDDRVVEIEQPIRQAS